MNTCNGCPELRRVVEEPVDGKYQSHHECKLHGDRLYWDEDQNPLRSQACNSTKTVNQ